MDKMMEKKFQAKKNFVHRKVAKKDVLIPIGGNVANFNGFIELNETAALIWDELKSSSTGHALVEKMTSTFDVTLDIAKQDIEEVLQLFLNKEMIEEKL